MKNLLRLFLLIVIVSCKDQPQKKEVAVKKTVPDQVVVITNNAPGRYPHILKQDSLGKKVKDSIGPKLYFPDYGFSYLNDQGNVTTWTPETRKPDTLVISTFTEFLELSSYNPFTSVKETFLVRKGDTVIFDYKDRLPSAKIANRDVNEIELNYNRYRHEKLFQNKYSPHQLVNFHSLIDEKFDPEQFDINTINNYKNSKLAYQQEVKLLDSLLRKGQISEINYQYRINALDGVMENHKNNRTIQAWLFQNRKLEKLDKLPEYDLTKTDSLVKFSFFRDHLNNISKYDLSFIEENFYGTAGSYYIDSKVRFDSILEDKRFNQTAKNFLLFEVYQEIIKNFKVKDKEDYYKKLQAATTDIRKLRKLKEDYKLNFSLSDQLVLTTLQGDTIEYREMIKKNNGKLLYVDFWASWCAPCRKTMPHSRNLTKRLQNENVEFIYLALNDKRKEWKEAIIKDSLQGGQHYFIENGNSSAVLEDLQINYIPHYIIYNDSGKLVNGFAKRPGKGAFGQLKEYISSGDKTL